MGQAVIVGDQSEGMRFTLFCAADAGADMLRIVGYVRRPVFIGMRFRPAARAAQLALRRVLVAVICVFPVMLKALLKGRATLAGGFLHFSGRCSYSARRTDVRRRRQLTASGRLPVKVQRAAC